ncbi:MAG: GNAT family N-acetyltransferase [Deltaproteobacteria bacterium]|nr:GNAT family N-acetyltransferase [Deltaproteobacteria bacterium]
MKGKTCTRRVFLSSPSWKEDFNWFLQNYTKALAEENHHHPLLAWRKIDPSRIEELRFSLETLLAQTEEACLLLAEWEGIQIGYFLGLLKTCLAEDPSRIGYLNGLYVSPEFRQKGVGKSLYQEGLAWFKSRGLNAIELYLAEGNSMGLKFWEKQGYAVAEKILVKRI